VREWIRITSSQSLVPVWVFWYQTGTSSDFSELEPKQKSNLFFLTYQTQTRFQVPFMCGTGTGTGTKTVQKLFRTETGGSS